MKQLLFVFATALVLQSCDGWDTASVEKKLSRDWQLEYVMEIGKKTEPGPDDEVMIMTFHPNHKLTTPAQRDSLDWQYEEAKKALIVDKDTSTIVELSGEKLVVRSILGRDTSEIHFKAPKK